jgi:hypothetical protein
MRDDTVQKIAKDFWSALNQIDARLPADGLSHRAPRQFVPFSELEDKWPAVKEAIGSVTTKVRAGFDATGKSA